MKIADYKGDPAVLAEDLVNTRGSISGADYMPDLPSLREFLAGHGLRPPKTLSEADLKELARARDRLKEVFFAPDEEAAAALLNEILEDLGAAPRLVAAGARLELQFAPEGAGTGRLVAIAAAMGLAQMLVDSGRSRLGICSAHDCADVFVDTSRNRSRRYCSESCSSRSNVAAFRARKRSS